MSDTEAGVYTLKGMKNPGEHVDRLVLEGTTVQPERYIDLNGQGELSADEVKFYRERGFDLRKVPDAQLEKQAERDNPTPPAEGEGEAPVVETREQQQQVQANETGTAPTSRSRKGN